MPMAERDDSGSMVRRILLGSQLRRLRESRGVTREAAGYSIRASESKISRMELGRVSFKQRDVADLNAMWDSDFWPGTFDQVDEWDRLIEDFNKRVGLM